MTDQELEELEQELEIKLTAWIRENTPKGMRIKLIESPFPHLELVCNGADPMVALYCCSAPGHKGECYSIEKFVNFRRRN